MNNELKLTLDNFSDFMKMPFENISDIKDNNKFFYKDEIISLVNYCNKDRDKIDVVLTKISDEFEEYDNLKANLLCHVCGALVEFGGNQDIVISHVIQKLKEALMWIVSAQMNHEIDDRKKVYIYISFAVIDYLITAAMTMLSRNSLEREKFKNDKDIQILIDTISLETSENIYYLKKIMELTDNLEMTIIHTSKRKGYKVKVDGVQNYFHFFTLLQGELIEKVGDELGLDKALFNKNAIDVARAERIPEETEKAEDKAIFSYYIWTALSLDKTLSKNVPLEQWVYGELFPKHTPAILNHKVVLIGDNVLAERSWDRSFFSPLHDALKPKVSIIAHLTETEVEDLLNKIVLEKSKIEETSTRNESVKEIGKDEKGFKKFFRKFFNK